MIIHSKNKREITVKRTTQAKRKNSKCYCIQREQRMFAFSFHVFIITVCLHSKFKTVYLSSHQHVSKKRLKLHLPNLICQHRNLFFFFLLSFGFSQDIWFSYLDPKWEKIIINNWFIWVDKMIWCCFLSLTEWSGWNCIPLIKLWWNVIRWMNKVRSQEKLLWLTWYFFSCQSFLGIWSHHCLCSHHIDFVVCY